VENVNAHIDDLITAGVLRRVLAFTELKFSNSMIEAWWRSLKHQWLFLHPLDSVTTVRDWSGSTSGNTTGSFRIPRRRSIAWAQLRTAATCGSGDRHTSKAAAPRVLDVPEPSGDQVNVAVKDSLPSGLER
jgi:NADH:ubiquinone oxidoreductase subunit